MPLPSQTARKSSRRSHMYSRRRRRPVRWALGAIASVAVAFGFWWFWPGSESPHGAETALSQTASIDAGSQNRTAADRTSADADPAITVVRPQPQRESKKSVQPERESSPPVSSSRQPSVEPAKLVMGQPAASQPRNVSQPPRQHSPALAPLTQPNATQSGAEQNRTGEAGQGGPAAGVAAPPSTGPAATSSGAQTTISSALAALESRPVESREVLTRALNAADVSAADQQRIRDALSTTSETLVFGPAIVPDDPYAIAYTVQDGDLLQKIVKKHSLQVDWRFISRINNADPKRIRVGQRLKLITGPFHCIVDKSDFRLDLYLGDGSQQVYVRSFRVGLGEFNSTPEGLFRVKPGSKAINPAWANPRTGETFEPNDPDNPIGEHWIGLEAVDEALQDVIGYGIHGTIEPDSIGREKSMGCIRLHDDDVALLYEVLVDEASLVRIVP